MKQGYIAIITVMIVMAVVMAITTTVTMLSIGAAQGSMAISGSEAVRNFTESCMENALELSRESISYSGGRVTTPAGSCDIEITKGGGNWTIKATPSVMGEYAKEITVSLVRGATGLVITSWKES